MTRPKESIDRPKAPLGARSSRRRSPLVSSRLQMPVVLGLDSYSSNCGYRCVSPPRGRSEVKMMRSSVP
jgi:hypothetical protein